MVTRKPDRDIDDMAGSVADRVLIFLYIYLHFPPQAGPPALMLALEHGSVVIKGPLNMRKECREVENELESERERESRRV
nr:hypothetical protein HmN_000450500 [Hymenolepis microstoma]